MPRPSNPTIKKTPTADSIKPPRALTEAEKPIVARIQAIEKEIQATMAEADKVYAAAKAKSADLHRQLADCYADLQLAGMSDSQKDALLRRLAQKVAPDSAPSQAKVHGG